MKNQDSQWRRVQRHCDAAFSAAEAIPRIKWSRSAGDCFVGSYKMLALHSSQWRGVLWLTQWMERLFSGIRRRRRRRCEVYRYCNCFELRMIQSISKLFDSRILFLANQNPEMQYDTSTNAIDTFKTNTSGLDSGFDEQRCPWDRWITNAITTANPIEKKELRWSNPKPYLLSVNFKALGSICDLRMLWWTLNFLPNFHFLMSSVLIRARREIA